MSRYVVLNFEDKIGGTGKGAADGTIKALTYRYTTVQKPKGLMKLFVGKHAVEEHRCVDEVPAIGFTSDATTISRIRAACGGAAKIYLVLHGDPRTTDTAYTNAIGSVGVTALCTSAQLADFLALVLPKKDKLALALVMCYGARCKNFRSKNVNHQGLIDEDDLRTSFAYRLFYELVHRGYSPILSAVTGKIQHDSTSGRALVEREELIDVNMDLAEIQRQFTQDAKAVGGGAEWKKTDTGKAQWDEITRLKTEREDVRKQLKGGDESNKYGKLVYRYKSGTLTIVNKYGGTGTGSVGPGTVIYSGLLWNPAPA
jgi:hypothetical protein